MKYHGPKDRRQAARAEETPEEELRELSQSEYIFVREAVAANSSTPGEVLSAMVPKQLVAEDDFRIALSVIKNPKIESALSGVIAGLVVEAIGRISPRECYPMQLLDAVVRCASAPNESLLPLTDPELIPKYIRGRMAASGVRLEVLTKLSVDPSSKISSRARRALGTKEVG